MKKLKQIEKTNGHTYKQLERIADWVVYEQINHNAPAPVTVGYEVFRVDIRKEAETPSGKKVGGGEYFPRTYSWGTNAWSLYTLDKAMNVFWECVSRDKKKYLLINDEL